MKKIEVNKPIGIVNTIPIPPARERTNSNERFMERVNSNGEEFFKYKIRN